MNNRAAIILLAFLLIPQTGKAQISFDPGEGCLNVVDFAAAKGLDEYHGHVFSVQYLHERFINELFCVGAGVGYSYLGGYDFSALPLFFSAHYFFLDRRFSPFVNLRTGVYFPFGSKEKQSGVNLYVAPGAGLKVHLTPHFGIMASVNYDGYLMKGPDALKMASALGAGIGLCFQIPGW